MRTAPEHRAARALGNRATNAVLRNPQLCNRPNHGIAVTAFDDVERPSGQRRQLRGNMGQEFDRLGHHRLGLLFEGLA